MSKRLLLSLFTSLAVCVCAQPASGTLKNDCRDKICRGDIPPSHDALKEMPIKVNGKWLFVDRKYGGFNGSLAFFWPSKTPVHSEDVAHRAPEFVPSASGRSSNFTQAAIEIFLRSTAIPEEPTGYRLIQLADRKGWIAERKNLREGLDSITLKHVIGPQGHSLDHVTYYVATRLRGFDGLPPVATCNHSRPDGSGGAGFMWRDGVWVGTRMNQAHCAEWPEIYSEIVRVLGEIRRAWA